jgi:hypothetical protein
MRLGKKKGGRGVQQLLASLLFLLALSGDPFNPEGELR